MFLNFLELAKKSNKKTKVFVMCFLSPNTLDLFRALLFCFKYGIFETTFTLIYTNISCIKKMEKEMYTFHVIFKTFVC